MNTKKVSYTIKIPQTDIHCIVIENSGFTVGGAEPDILNCGGNALIHLQFAVGIPGMVRKNMMDSFFFGPQPNEQISEILEKIVPTVKNVRKRKVNHYFY